MSGESEKGSKWWVRFAIVPIVVAGVAAAAALMSPMLTTPTTPPTLAWPSPLPTGLPSPTPKPTVIGTPIIGANIAVGGKVGSMVMANAVSLIVDEVKAYSTDLSGFPERGDYALVVVKFRVANESQATLSGYTIRLVDDYSNEYVTWSIFDFGVPEFPVLVEPGISAAGALVYRVPRAALTNSLRLRLDVQQIDTRIEIFFDSIGVENP
jgi:hypothetical protein